MLCAAKLLLTYLACVSVIRPASARQKLRQPQPSGQTRPARLAAALRPRHGSLKRRPDRWSPGRRLVSGSWAGFLEFQRGSPPARQTGRCRTRRTGQTRRMRRSSQPLPDGPDGADELGAPDASYGPLPVEPIGPDAAQLMRPAMSDELSVSIATLRTRA